MNLSNVLNSLGLILDLIGVIIIFLFGISPRFDTKGQTFRITGEVDYNEIRKVKRFKLLSWSGLFILFIGFLLQLISNII